MGSTRKKLPLFCLLPKKNIYPLEINEALHTFGFFSGFLSTDIKYVVLVVATLLLKLLLMLVKETRLSAPVISNEALHTFGFFSGFLLLALSTYVLEVAALLLKRTYLMCT